MKKYIVSSVIPDQEIEKGFLDSLKSFCSKNKAELILIKLKPFSNKDLISPFWKILEEELQPYLIEKSKKIGNQLLITDHKPKIGSADPLTGLETLSSKHGNIIVPFVNHRFKVSPRMIKESEMPRGMWCSGTISKCDDYPEKYSNKKQFYHCGALFVQLEDNENEFHIRQISYNGKGFYDLDKYYSGDKIETVTPIGLSMGDDHATQLCQKTVKETKRIINKLKIPRIYHHDTLDWSNNTSHHQVGKEITRAKNTITVEEELKLTSDYIQSYQKDIKHKLEQHIVPSNHPEHMDKWIEYMNFKEDPTNLIIGLEIALLKAKGFNIYKETMKWYNPLKNVKFYTRNDHQKLAGNEMLDHGDYGTNGSKSNTKQKGVIYTGMSITGHTHSPEIGPLNNYVNGTKTKLTLDYTNPSGASSWLNTDTLVYLDGNKTHIHYIFGKTGI